MDCLVRPSQTDSGNNNQTERAAMPGEISIEDRLRIQDLLMSYVWANDSANLEGIVAAFTPDGIVQTGTGERLPVEEWASSTLAHPGRRGRQHWVQIMSMHAHENGCAVRSYWKVVQWLVGPNTRTVNAMGYYDDICTKVDGHWRIREKRIHRCNDMTTLPW
jgi:hypothetical protein